MENRLASISTIVRMGPLLGLLGTVASMIAAFNRIGGAEQVNPRALASDISLALGNGAGSLIANPMMLLATMSMHDCESSGIARNASSKTSWRSSNFSRIRLRVPFRWPGCTFRNRHTAGHGASLLISASILRLDRYARASQGSPHQ